MNKQLADMIGDVFAMLNDVTNQGDGHRQPPDTMQEWQYRGFDCTVKRVHVLHSQEIRWHYCGYATANNDALPELRWLTEEEREEIEVHGGITYFEAGEYGFDCAHWNDLRPDAPCREVWWVNQQVIQMVEQIIGLLGKDYTNSWDIVDGETTPARTNLYLEGE